MPNLGPVTAYHWEYMFCCLGTGNTRTRFSRETGKPENPGKVMDSKTPAGVLSLPLIGDKRFVTLGTGDTGTGFPYRLENLEIMENENGPVKVTESEEVTKSHGFCY